MVRTKKRIAVVTGATGGIGGAICHRLHQDGYAIIGQYRSNHQKADALGKSIGASGGVFIPVACDLSTNSGVDAVIAAANSAVIRIPGIEVHALVNNAAKLLGPAFFTATTDEFDEYFALNVRAPYFLSQRIAPFLQPGGSIVNISSAGVHFSSPGDIVYSMSKAALESLTRNMAEAIADLGLRVNTVVPGFTDNGHDAFRNEKVQDYMSSFSVLGGVAQPSVVADAVSFLISDRAGRTTGASLDVSGGSTLGARKRSVASVGHLIGDGA